MGRLKAALPFGDATILDRLIAELAPNFAEGNCGRCAAQKRIIVKQSNAEIVAAFRERLKKVAGFGFIPEPFPMRNSTIADLYYLFFASPNPVAEKILNGILRKYK